MYPSPNWENCEEGNITQKKACTAFIWSAVLSLLYNHDIITSLQVIYYQIIIFPGGNFVPVPSRGRL